MNEIYMGRDFTRCMIPKRKDKRLQIFFPPYSPGPLERRGEIDVRAV
jgi:hypothetical protein